MQGKRREKRWQESKKREKILFLECRKTRSKIVQNAQKAGLKICCARNKQRQNRVIEFYVGKAL